MTVEESSSELAATALRAVADAGTVEGTLAATLRLGCDAGWAAGEAWLPDGEGLRLGPVSDPADPDRPERASKALAARAADGPVWNDVGGARAVAVPVELDGAVLVFRDPDEEFPDEEFPATVAAAARTLAARPASEQAALDGVLDATPVGIIVFSPDGDIERLNRPAADLLGVERARIVGVSAFDERWDASPLDGHEEETPVETVLRTGESVLDHRTVLSFDDRELTLSVSAAPLRDADGNVAKVIGTVVDVSDRADHERRLEEKNRQLESFASVLSHDLRSPLAVATGFLDLARETGDLSYLDRVDRGHERIEELVDTLLVLARKGRMIGTRTPVSVAEVAEQAWATVEQEGLALVRADAVEVEADPVRLRQLFENLLRNAAEHAAPEPGEPVTVTVGSLTDGGGFYVEDDGVGIPESMREDVLRPGHEARGGGFGLGLSIVAAIAEGHGWEVSVTESEPGGARFEFRTTAAE